MEISAVQKTLQLLPNLGVLSARVSTWSLAPCANINQNWELYQHRPQIAKTNFCVINAKNNVTSAKIKGSFSGCFFWMPLLCKVPWAPRNGTVVTPAPNYNGTLQLHHVHSQSWSLPSPPTVAHYNGTLQWHHVHSPKVGHPAPQPYKATRQWHHVHSLKVGCHPPPPTIAHYNGTLQWHHAHSPKVGRHPTPTIVHNGTVRWHQQWHHGTLQWHPAMAPTSTPPKLVVTLPPTIAHYNGTLRWDPAMAPRPLHPAMAFWCHVQSAKVVRRHPPLLEVRTPIAIEHKIKPG